MEYREFEIPKKNGKKRKIVAPDAELETFHGFIKNRNCVSAAIQHIGYAATLMMDISQFFDSVKPEHLTEEFKNDKLLWHKDGYAAQGFPSSPMLANIAILPVIHDILNRFKKELKTSETRLTVYADDIQISVDYLDEIAEAERIVKEAFAAHGFIINETKTRVKHAKYGYRRILGINVGKTSIQATRKTKRRIRAIAHNLKQIEDPLERKRLGQILGGITVWGKCLLPKGLRETF